MPDSWTEFDQIPRSLTCTREAHRDCPHFAGMGGGGLNPRRLRLEFGTILCRCSCHAECVLSGTSRMAVPFKVWRDSCTCPGGGRARRRMAEAGTEPPDFREIRERQEQVAQARKDAFQAASCAAAGRSRDEIRELYLAELRSRGLEPPSEQFLEATVERIAGNPSPSVRLVGEGLAQMAKVTVGLGRLLRDISRTPR
jgi:hypothetical protein